MIDERLLKKHHMRTLEEYKEDWGDNLDTEETFYRTFLIQTDYIHDKISDAETEEEQALLEKEYAGLKKQRNFARSQIQQIQKGKNK